MQIETKQDFINLFKKSEQHYLRTARERLTQWREQLNSMIASRDLVPFESKSREELDKIIAQLLNDITKIESEVLDRFNEFRAQRTLRALLAEEECV